MELYNRRISEAEIPQTPNSSAQRSMSMMSMMRGTGNTRDEGMFSSTPIFTPWSPPDRRKRSNAKWNTETFRIVGAFLLEFTSNAVSMIVTMIPELINLAWMGRYGSDAEVAAIGLGNSVQTSFGLAVAFGLNSAFDLFASTTASAEARKEGMTYLSRGSIANTMYFLMICPLFWNTEFIFLSLRQDPDVSAYAAQYNKATLLGLWFTFQVNGFNRFLSNQGHARYCAQANMMTIPFHFIWLYFFVGTLNWGNYGLGIANSITCIIQYAVFLSYFLRRFDEYGMTLLTYARAFVSWRSWRGMGSYMQVAIPAALQMASSWIWWDVLVILVGMSGDQRQVVAHVAVYTIGGIIMQVFYGLVVTTTGYLGEAIGSEDVALAKRLYAISTRISYVIVAVACVPLLTVAPYLASFFTRDATTLHITIVTLRICAVSYFFCGISNVLGGIMRLCRRSRVVALVFLFQNWIVSLCATLLLCFYYHFGVYGVWAASGIGAGVGLVLLMFLSLRIDLNMEVVQARMRLLAERTELQKRTPFLL